ncbi:hypothetical protein [Candidatus Odyssella thessalonicensis]|uniref:hypothetical protein n=1 Tax=Candidatus Odyssella thessalonicensis TaxID=84647 RepID=UPI000225B746|nr:hypothetical protein [Candidatus Odyssella thessalonicensis]
MKLNQFLLTGCLWVMTCTANDFQDNNDRVQKDILGGIAAVVGVPEQADLE